MPTRFTEAAWRLPSISVVGVLVKRWGDKGGDKDDTAVRRGTVKGADVPSPQYAYVFRSIQYSNC